MQAENSPVNRKRSSFIEQARREQILKATSETVAQIGYANTSLSRIAEQAGISKSVISYHFDGKDELLTRVAEQFIEAAGEYMSARISAESTASGQVKTWISGQIEYFGAHRTGFLAMSAVLANHRPTDGSRPFAAPLEEEVEELTGILRRGQEEGEFREFAPRSTATIILRCIEGLLTSWAVDPSVDLENQLDTLLDFVHHAIRREDR